MGHLDNTGRRLLSRWEQKVMYHRVGCLADERELLQSSNYQVSFTQC